MHIHLGRVITLGAALMAVMPWQAMAAFINVYGAPTYTPGVGGFQGDHVPASGVNAAGTAVGSAHLLDGSGGYKDLRAVRWNSAGATELGNLGTSTSGGANVEVRGINDAGTAVGNATKYASGVSKGPRAVRWGAASTAATELGHLGTDSNGVTLSYAFAINTGGTAVGSAWKVDGFGAVKGERAVRWDGSGTTATELGHLGTDTSGTTASRATTVNAAGTAVGFAHKYDGGLNLGPRPVRWEASSTTAIELGNLGADSGGFASNFAYALNSAGTAVGSAEKYDGTGAAKGTRAVRWDASGTAAFELGNLGTSTNGVTDSIAFAVNTSGAAVGYARKYDGSGVFRGERAVRWEGIGDVATELGNLGTDTNGVAQSFASAISTDGFIVGSAQKYDSFGASLGSRAVYWDLDGLAMDLNTLIEPASGWMLTSARAISDTGWISGKGTFDPDGPGAWAAYERLFVLQIPELSGMAGDFNHDAAINATDIDLLCNAIDAGGTASFDVNHDGMVDSDDLTYQVETILHTKFGDTDTDGDVDLADIGNLASGFGQPGEKRWGMGNFDCDDDVDLNDLGVLASNFEGDRATALAQFTALVPEPAAGLLFLALLPGMHGRRR